MTTRSEFSHRLVEAKARLQTKIAARLFSLQPTWSTILLKRVMKIDNAAAYHDPELEHSGD